MEKTQREFFGWIATAFSLPAALSVLESLDERLSFGPILERIILNFSIVSKQVWSSIESYVSLDVSEIHLALTFNIICICLWFRDFMVGGDTVRRSRYAILFEIFSQAFLVCIFLGLFDSNYILSTAALCFACLFFLADHFYIKNHDSSAIYGIVSVFLLISLVILGSKFTNTFDMASASGVLIAFAVLQTNKIVGRERLFFSRVLVFSVGIYLIDYVHSVFIPNINQWLDGIGA